MCLLTFLPESVKPDEERFKIAALNNPDGFGFAILDKTKIHKGHGMSFKETMDKFLEMRDKYSGPALFHFRWATHGSETLDNCHPFTLGNDESSVVAHNGILPVAIPTGDKRSDTKVFAEDIMPAIGGITSLDNDKYHQQLSEWAKGNKLVYLTNNDDAMYDWYIINEQLGHWDKDMWWSNNSYEKSSFVYAQTTNYSRGYSHGYSSSGIYGGGWDDDWDYASIKQENYYEISDNEMIKAAYIQEEIDECFDKMDAFMTAINTKEQLVECHACGVSEIIRINEFLTQCNACKKCLYCGSPGDCGCWDALYESFDEEQTIVSY